MIRTIALLCLAAPAFGFFSDEPWEAGLKIKHGSNLFGIGSKNQIDLPMSNNSALGHGYIKMNRPRMPGGYCPLQLWCRMEDKYRCCIFTDETGDVAGIQFNIPVDEFVPKYDIKEQGFTIWTTILDNTIVKYYAFFQFFVAPDSQNRIESKDTTVILRDSVLYYSGFGGQLASVATDISQLYSIFAKQNCINGLGNVYFYNMTTRLECSASTLSPFTAVFHSEQLVATRVIVFGTWAKNSQYKDLYEEISHSDKKVVKHGPKCLFDDFKHGGLSMTFFYTSKPWLITCLFQ